MNNDQILIANQFKNDPRIQEAKNLLKEALSDNQRAITGIRPPQAALAESYQSLIKELSSLRGNKLFYPYIGSGIGKGCLVELLDGSIKYDFITGIGPHCFGHSSLELLDANIDAALSDIVMQGNLQQNEDSLDICKLLTEESHMDHCFLTTSGVMANENALKIAFQKNHPASRIICFEHCFFGRSLAASQVTDKPTYRDGLPLNYLVDYIPFYDHKKPQESMNLAADVLKKTIARYPKQHAAMIFELIQGEGGFHTAPREFFLSLIEIVKAHNIAVIVDEVQSFGRTSHLFAFQYFGLDPFVDIVTIGKLSQVCATLYNTNFSPKPGLLSQTFIASTSALKVGREIIKKLIDGNYYGAEGKIVHLHSYMVKALTDLKAKYPSLIEGPFGVGAMIAFTPFGGNTLAVNEFAQKLFEAGVIAFIAGSDPTRIRFLVPFASIEKEDIDQVMQIVETLLISSKKEI